MFDPAWARAIASIESAGSGGYNALGPVTGSGDRAYGKYQVMGNNIPQWTKQHLGREMSPEEFLADPAAQDQVFEKQFGSTADKYGSPQEAASIWFTGRPMAKGANARDVLGTTGSGYVSKFNKALGQPADGPSAIAAALGQSSQPDGDVMAYAPDQQNAAAPTTTPPPDNGFMGQLGSYLNGLNYTNPKTGYQLTDAMTGISAALADDPARSKAILDASTRDKLANQKSAGGTFQYDDKSGMFFRTRADGTLETKQNPNFTPENKGPKVNDKVLKALTDHVEKYGAISQISDEGAKVLDDIQNGKLNLGAVSNLENSGRNMSGANNESSLAYARYKQFIQKLADTELLKAKGVQTEGDAYRVMQEIGAGGAGFNNDAARESITKLLLRNKEAVTGHGRSVLDAYKGAYGADNPAFAPITQQFDGFGKVYDNIDQMLSRGKQPPTAAAPAAATGNYRVIKVHP